MRPLAAACFFFLLISGQNHAQTKSAHDQAKSADTNSTYNPPSQVIQIAAPCGESTSAKKQDQPQKEPKPWLTHGEWVMSILTFIYVVVAILTWRKIGQQWTAMKHSNEISRKNLEAVQRAFVFVRESALHGERDPSGKIIAWHFRAIWENSGTTPSRQLRLYAGAIYDTKSI